MSGPSTLAVVSRSSIGVAALAALAGGCSIVEGNRAVCPIDVGELSLRVLEDEETISVTDAASEGGVDDGLVVGKTDAAVVLVRTESGVDVLALGSADEVDGTWSEFGAASDCRLEDGPAFGMGTSTDGAATLDLDGTLVVLPAPTALSIGTLTSVTESRSAD
ncbi:MAG: hypothetical protein AB8G26_06055 [Ilumatobacter sp.]